MMDILLYSRSHHSNTRKYVRLVKPELLNRCFANLVYTFMPKKARDLTIPLDGKTIYETNRIEK